MAESIVESPTEAILNLYKTERTRVLHVDDDPAFLKVAKQCLEMQGIFAVDTASSVNEASEKLKKTDYDAVVCDYQMLDEDGLEFLKELRENGNTVPFIVFTGKGREEVAIEALNLGADRYLNKHGDPETVYCELAHAIRQAVDRRSAQVELSRKEARLNAILESSPEAITITDLDGNIVECNQAALDMHGGQSKENFIGRNSFELIARKDRERAIQNLKKTFEQGSVKNVEYTLRTKDGREFPAELSASVVRGASGKPECLVAITRDISERKKAEEELKASEEKLRDVFACSPDAITVIDLNGNIVECNQTTLDMLGYSSKDELIGRNGFALVSEKDRERAKGNLAKVLDHGPMRNIEYVALTKDGTEFHAELSASVVKDSSGNPTGFVSIIKDLTERKKAEEALRESMEGYRELAESISDMFFAMDKDFRYTYWNKASEELTGISAKDAIGKSLTEVFPDVRGTGVEQFYKKALRTRQPQSYLNKYHLRGKAYVFEINAYPTRTGLSVFVKDVTERKKVEQQLRIKETAVASSVNGVAFADLEGKLTYVNSSFLEMWGYANENEVLGRPAEDFWVSKENAVEAVKALMHKGGWVGELTAKKKDGSTFEVQLSASTVKDETGKPSCMMGSFLDVTERRKAGQSLKESEEKYRGLVELAPDGVVAVNAEGTVTSANRSFLTLVGYDSEREIVGKPFTELATMRKEDVLRMQELLMSLMKGESPSPSEFLYVRRDGTSRWAEVHPGLLIKDGKPVGAQAIMRDVTERKNAEKLIQEKQQMFEQLFMSNPEAVVYVDQNERVLNVSPRFTELFAYSFDEVKGKFLDDFVVPEDRKQEALMLAQKGREGYVYHETVRKNKEGSLIPVAMSSSPTVLQGQHLGDIVTYMDITERKKAEEEKSRLLQNLQERVKELDCFYGISRLVEKSDISLDDVLQGTADLLPPAMQYPDITCARVVVENREFSTKNFKETRWKLQTDIKVHGKKAGFVEVCYLEERPTIAEGPFLKDERQLMDAITERLGKITERRKAEDALRDAKEKWASLTENTDDVVMIADSEGIIQFINRTIQPYTPEETIGKTVYEYVPREQHDVMRISLKKTFETGVPLSYVVSSNIPKIGTMWFETKIVPVKVDEKTVSAILMSTDITELRNAEESLKEANMKLVVTNEKLHVVGGLTRHDVRNKLSAVTGNAYLLRQKLAEDPKALEQLADMEAAVRLVEKIFEFARIYEKLGTEQLVSIDVGKAVDGAVSLFSGLKGVKVVNECGGLTVLADSLLSQLFYNLIDNSLKYGENTRQIKIHYRAPSADQLELVYEDDGVGIPDSMRSNLFKEGFTSGKGTGYGLFMIKRVCEVYGWTIRETGRQGKGAQFTINMPKAKPDGKPNCKLG